MAFQSSVTKSFENKYPRPVAAVKTVNKNINRRSIFAQETFKRADIYCSFMQTCQEVICQFACLDDKLPELVLHGYLHAGGGCKTQYQENEVIK